MLKKVGRLRVKLSALALAVMAFALVGHAVLGVTYLQQQRENDALALEIEAARQALVASGDAGSHQEQRTSAEAELVAAQAALPSRLNGPGVVGALIRLAEETGLKVSDVKTVPGREQQVGERTYAALSIHVEVEGTLSALRAFVSRMESGALQAARLDELSIAMKEQPSVVGAELLLGEAGATERPTSLAASLDYSVYARN